MKDPRDLEMEPLPGLPEPLPPGERIVWQGRPSWRALATHAFKLPWLALYFAVWVAAKTAVAVSEAQPAGVVYEILLMVLVFGVGLAIVLALAWFQARATVYTITERRVVMQIGVVLSTTWNLPFKRLASADLSLRGPGDGDIVLGLVPPDRIAWLHLWPHARRGLGLRANPALRCVPEPEHVAELLERAVTRWANDRGVSVATAHDGESSAPRGQGSPIAVGRKLGVEAG